MVSKINWLVPQKSEAPIFLQRTRNLSSAEVSILGLGLRRELTDIAGFLIFHHLRGGLTLVYSIHWLNYFELNVGVKTQNSTFNHHSISISPFCF